MAEAHLQTQPEAAAVSPAGNPKKDSRASGVEHGGWALARAVMGSRGGNWLKRGQRGEASARMGGGPRSSDCDGLTSLLCTHYAPLPNGPSQKELPPPLLPRSKTAAAGSSMPEAQLEFSGVFHSMRSPWIPSFGPKPRAETRASGDQSRTAHCLSYQTLSFRLCLLFIPHPCDLPCPNRPDDN